MSIGTLYVEELKATMRGLFTWLGAAVILFALGGLATASSPEGWLDAYAVIAYLLAPLTFIPMVAGAIASPRANRFVESVFTAPVERRDWFAAKILVLLTLAAAYYAALAPMMLVYIAHVGMPLLLKKCLIAAPILLVSSVAVGSLVGVLFIGRSIAAPVATGVGVLLAYAGTLPLQELLVARGNGSGRLGGIMLISPAVMLKNALGFTVAVGMIPSTTALTWISLLVVIMGAFALAVWIFLCTQGVETWETTEAQKWVITLAIFAIALFPIFFADRNYDTAAPHPNAAPAVPGLFARGNGSLSLTSPGGQLPMRCCGTILNRDEAIGTDEASRRDLIVLLPVGTEQTVTGLNLQIAGNAGLEVEADPRALDFATQHLEAHTYASELGPNAADGHHLATGWIARVPVTLRPTNPWDIGADHYPITATATYHVAGDPQPRTLRGRGAVEAGIRIAIYQMGLASALLPALFLGAAIRRRRKTR
jgi:hypothetical protein